MQKIIIAIDGFSACGKSTTAKAVAKNLGYIYIDSGAMYRAVTLFFHDNYVSISNAKEVTEALENIKIKFFLNEKTCLNEIYLNGLNVEEEIRKMYISEKVSEVSAISEVRRAMVARQQKLGKKRGVVMDGRDIGTHVFPDAELKFFMTADMLVRAQRRQKEFAEKDQHVDLEDIIENIRKRDLIDTTRAENPLIKAPDAVELDTTFMTIDEQIDFVMSCAMSKIVEKQNSFIDS